MKTSKKPASSSKAKKRVTLSKAKGLKAKKRDSSPAAHIVPMPSRESDKTRSETRVEIKPAKGRPMLTWVGKKPLRHAIAYPAQLVETFNVGADGHPPLPAWTDWPKDMPQTGLLFHGDNKDVLAYLLANGFRGKVKLIYIDPPFDSGADYVRQVKLRGTKTNELEATNYSLGEQLQYIDIWANDNYLQFMYERLLMLRELLADGGAIFLHCDNKKGHHLHSLLDEVFSPNNFVNEIIWSYKRWPSSSNAFQSMHDTIYYYGNEIANKRTFHKSYEEASESYMKRFGGKTQRLDEETGTRKITMEEETKGMPTRDVWDISIIAGFKSERTQYPTQKPEELITKIIEACSNPNDLILDCFVGSGTTAAVAQKLGRRWIGADINKGAIQTTEKRLQRVIQEQLEESQEVKQIEMPIAADMRAMAVQESQEPYNTPEMLEPAQLAFSVYRVNDYDLQIQHNEAFNLAVEHLGMTRTKTDAFFDGTLGRKLVKIVPFNHPVTPLDLEEVKRELKNRPEEERDIAVVGLGKEVAVEAWLDEWNKLRKQGSVPNKIEVIELRSDPKYGGFFTHEPAKAKVSFKREKENVEITIDDFISPTILERLHQQNKDNPLFKPQVSDWKSMVDSIMIDSAYDGKVFNITLADVPEKKNDLVEGKYVVEVKKGATVAVKITDMLGEEVLVLS
jgi:DNA modification methylase